VAGFAPWAVAGHWFHRAIGEAGLYAACAVTFIGLSGLLLHRLIIGPGSLTRFYKLFGLAFAAYAITWILAWMTIRGHAGGIAGLFAGTAIMGWIFVRAFDATGEIVKVVAALFVFNALGYFIGGWVEAGVVGLKELSFFGLDLEKPVRVTLAQLLWGVCYGVGLGAGLGLAFYYCQTNTRALLSIPKG
jgi:hypothetical protein